MNRIAWRIGMILGGALPLACARESDVAEDVRQMISRGDPVLATTRTENGVTVHEYSADAFQRAPQWTLERDPAATIGGADGDPQYDLTRVSYVVPLSDGRVITFARVGNKVLVFGRDGKGERIIGRTGQGPGDWMAFGDPVLLENDTVLVVDFANNRLNWVTADGGVVRTAPYDVTLELRGMHGIAGLLSTGELLFHSAGSWGRHQTDSLQRSLAGVMAARLTTIPTHTADTKPELHGATGNTRSLGTLPDLQGVEVETRFRGRARKHWQPLRLSGWALLTAWDSVYASVHASSHSIELRDAKGALRARIEVPVTRRQVTQSMRDAQIARELREFKGPASERMVDPAESERLARESPFADSLPYFAHLKTGSDRTLWVVDAIAPDDSGWTATAFGRDGAILARLTATSKSIPMAFGANQVIVRTEDEDGVVSLRVYRFADKR